MEVNNIENSFWESVESNITIQDRRLKTFAVFLCEMGQYIVINLRSVNKENNVS